MGSRQPVDDGTPSGFKEFFPLHCDGISGDEAGFLTSVIGIFKKGVQRHFSKADGRPGAVDGR